MGGGHLPEEVVINTGFTYLHVTDNQKRLVHEYLLEPWHLYIFIILGGKSIIESSIFHNSAV